MYNSNKKDLNKNSESRMKTQESFTRCEKCHRKRGCRGPEGKIGPIGPPGPIGMMKMAIGEIFYQGSTLTTLTEIDLVVGVPRELRPVTNLITSEENFDNPENGRLRYLGDITTLFQCSFSSSIKPQSGSNQLIFFELRKNGTSVPGGGFQQLFQSSSDFQGITLRKVISLSTNDYISVYVTNLSGCNRIGIYNLNIVSVGDGSHN